METLKLYKFRENCCCCYSSIDCGINVCKCYLSFCDRHFNFHVRKTSCELLYRVEKNKKLKIKNCDLSSEDMQKALERLGLILKCNNYDEKVIFKDNEVECPDLANIEFKEKISIGKLDTLKCTDCEVSKHLYICFTCGFIGCGRIQYGIEGNGHANQHYKILGHPIFVLISSITPEYSCDTFCYNCNEFVINPFCESKINCVEFAAPGKSWIDSQYTAKESVSNIKSPFIGIKNAGNTCFISSVLQLLGFIVSKENVDFNRHFKICEEQNPLNCIYCQSCKIFNKMMEQKKTLEGDNISIVDFIKLIWSKFTIFEKNLQHDANEFLILYLDLIREGEFLGIFPNISQFFLINIENVVCCNFCKDKKVAQEEHLVVNIPFKNTLQNSIKEHFKDHLTECTCGNEKLISNRIISLPKYLITTVGRCKIENQRLIKIVDSLGVDEVNLLDFLKKPLLSNFFIQELVSKGFKKEEIYLALSSEINFKNNEDNIIKYKENHRTNPVYKIQGSIIHTGTNMNAGHYMWFALNSNTFYLVNDKKITEEGVEYLEQSYILCLQ